LKIELVLRRDLTIETSHTSFKMTQPSLDTTFDTSLIDLAAEHSFSTTESLPSEKGINSTEKEKVRGEGSFPISEPITRPTLVLAKGDQLPDVIDSFISLLQVGKAHDHPRVGIILEENNSVLENRLTRWLSPRATTVSVSSPLGCFPSTTNATYMDQFDGMITTLNSVTIAVQSCLLNIRSMISLKGVVLFITQTKSSGQATGEVDTDRNEEDSSFSGRQLSELRLIAANVGFDFIEF
jgi:hypothetical protein